MAIEDYRRYKLPVEVGVVPSTIPDIDVDTSKSKYYQSYIFHKGTIRTKGRTSSYYQYIYGNFDYSSTSRYKRSKITSIYTSYGTLGSSNSRNSNVTVSDVLKSPYDFQKILLRNSDTIYGTAYDDTIASHGGNDIILGEGGNDTIYAGSGNDTIRGGSGNDIIYGDGGNDTIYADSGNDRIMGGSGNDYIGGMDGIDTAIYDYKVESLKFTGFEGILKGLYIVKNTITGDEDRLSSIEKIYAKNNRGYYQTWNIEELLNSSGGASEHKTYTLNIYNNLNGKLSESDSFKEGDSFTFKVKVTGEKEGKRLYWRFSPGYVLNTLSDVNRDDFTSGRLTGSAILNNNGELSVNDKFEIDQLNDYEHMEVKIYSDSNRSNLVASSGRIIIKNTTPSTTKFDFSQNKSTKDIVDNWFSNSTAISSQIKDISDSQLDITTNTWDQTININRVSRASSAGGLIQAKQTTFNQPVKSGSVIEGGTGADTVRGLAGWDVLDSGAGDDLVHGGNGRDIITGGSGADELHGDFGWNTYRSEKDGAKDLIVIKSDQHLSNWIYGKAGNNPNGEKVDIIEGLDVTDEIKIVGVFTPDLTFSQATAKGVSGIGIYAKGALEGLYTGGDLSIAQIQGMTTGDPTAKWSYRTNATTPDLLA
ncbi:hypothetical protein [Prochlorococcus sp. MIT 1300]|uniref:calcium-binding protein n=1 Tax=Prochlorococcus sp. MIT 1300 TaxID=3096218 RepID=UPI002A747CC5|nr:hypothetical protein [Prochlorococcus sp. MIT 1300]